jgi:hypothetical protein
MTDPTPGLGQPAADEALLKRLAEALGPVPLTPPPASVAALRREVDMKWKPTVWARVMAKLSAWARRLQHTGAAVAVLGGVAVGGTGIALAAGGSTQRPVQYTHLYPGSPLPSPAAHHQDRGRDAIRPSATSASRAAPALRPVSTGVSARGARPASAAAAATTTSPLVVTSGPAERGAAGVGGAPLRVSAPTSYPDRSVAGSGLSSTGRTPAFRTYRAATPVATSTWRTTGSTPTARWPGSTTGTRGTGPGWPETGAGAYPTADPAGPASTAGSWGTGPGWPETGGGAYPTAGPAAPTSTAGSWDGRSARVSPGDRVSTPTTRDRYGGSRTSR